jgi:electron transfer flavoprotein beta subunit
VIVACLKWSARPDAPEDDRFAGVSPADQAALETALALGTPLGEEVVAISVGPIGAEAALRNAIACGAARAVRVELVGLAEPEHADSRDVAAAIAGVAAGASIVLCGDYSLDRGSGSVPAFVAHRLGAAQALGLVGVEVTDHGTVRAVRRLDGGRREVLDVPTPCVLSTEGSVATLRRAGLKAALASRQALVEVHSVAAEHQPHAGSTAAYRPRARVLAPPQGDAALDRLRALTDAAGGSHRGEAIDAPPAEAAARIVEALRGWGYLG